MKFQVVTLLALLVATISADCIEIISNCDGIFGCSRSGGWYNSWGEIHPVDGENGCRRPNVPGVSNVCFDWPRRRGHFDAPGFGKRCFAMIAEWGWYCGSPTCFTTWFDETPCTWREAPPLVDANSTVALNISPPDTTPTAKASAFRA